MTVFLNWGNRGRLEDEENESEIKLREMAERYRGRHTSGEHRAHSSESGGVEKGSTALVLKETSCSS